MNKQKNDSTYDYTMLTISATTEKWVEDQPRKKVAKEKKAAKLE
jgi:hypothetical protein